MTQPLPILIAGGGIGGLAAAFVLARDGHAVTVLEQSAAFGEIGAGIQLGPNIFRMFEYLGLTDAVSQVAFFPPGLGMNDVRTGEKVVRVPLGDTARAAYGFPYGVIYRADLHTVFLDACRALPHVTLRTGAKVASFDQSADAVRVTLEGGEMLDGAALIGADGLWSRIREAIVGDGKPRVSGHIAYRAVLKREDVPAHLWSDDVLLWGGEKTHLVHYPLRRGELFNLVAVFHSNKYDEGWNTFGDTAELTERFAQAVPQVRELLGKIETWKMWVLCDREPVKNWSDRRVTLLGDAAHPMLPYLAQGAGMAVEDAAELARALAMGDIELPLRLKRYALNRWQRVARVQQRALRNGHIFHAGGPLRLARDASLRLLGPRLLDMPWLYGHAGH